MRYNDFSSKQNVIYQRQRIQSFNARVSRPMTTGIYSLLLSMYMQGLLQIEKEFLIPNNSHCGGTNCTGYDPNILVSTRQKCVIDANR